MITIRKQEYIDSIDTWSQTYASKLLHALTTTSTYIDSAYAQQVIHTLGTFCPVIRMQCLHDMQMFHIDTAAAVRMQEDYTSFGEFCYEMLYDAYLASNECMALNNQLYADIDNMFVFEVSDLSIASNYIALNIFSNTAILTLSNFRRLTGLGLCYDMQSKVNLQGTNVQENVMPKFKYLTEIANFADALQNNVQLQTLLDNWSDAVNDRLSQRKANAELAWHVTFECFKAKWGQPEFVKQVKHTICTMRIVKDRFEENLHRLGINKQVCWFKDDLKIVQLDYVNMLNFTFE